MEHRFYIKSEKDQNRILTKLAIITIVVILISIIISIKSGLYLIGIFMFSVIISIIAPFFDTPSLKKSGKLIYYSSLFLTEKPKDGIIKIHGGTLFDYYFVIDKKMKGNQRTKFILQQYLQGLLCLIEKHRDKSEMKLQGTSYIINKRTAEKIGFKIIQTDFLQKLTLIYNYFNLLTSNSIAKKKISFPNLKNINTFEADISQLIEREEYIKNLNKLLKSNLTDVI